MSAETISCPDGAPVLRTFGLGKSYGRTVALRDLELAIEPGEVFGYLGPNGAGKTTTLRLIAGMLRPSTGRAEVFGLDTWSRSPEVHRRIGYLPGEPGLYDRMTGLAHVTYFAHLRGTGYRRDLGRARALAERLDLDLGRPARTLSKGNKQKLALVLALMSEPDLLILDEPTTGLDPLVQQEFHAILRERTGAGGSVLLSSHVLAEVQRVADRVGVLRAGRLVAVERLDTLRGRSLHHISVQVDGPVGAAEFERLPGLRELRVDGGRLRCSAPQSALDELLKAVSHYRVVDLECTEAELEETFLAYYGAADAAGPDRSGG